MGERFTRALSTAVPGELTEPELLPSRLARACVATLDVDAAGLGVHSDPGLRIPIGSSDPAATHAERLQFSLGVGPSAEARSAGTVLTFDADDLARNWPSLFASLSTDTPFQEIMSVPLQGPLAGVVVLDLYVREAGGLARVDAHAVDVVARVMTQELVRAALFSEALTGGPGWMEGEDVRRRSQVWQAMGMITMVTDLDSADALAALRGRAFALGRLVDDLSADIVTGVLDPGSLLV
ncbi:hypothetical protein GB931_14000 [Modestobacter sp. I12A-02628]|uniref:ANTAR domain-containing protein n=1 Tax=Goekera deserti TaxID=2497753 RepID=A0A7K3WIY2_9ACTN|nr:hypothetical protein [Goekera deserti]NDI47349.1 hypothetical protein [Goekera deserti]NEL55879.1 hypothetical protein [Goekera deserti]